MYGERPRWPPELRKITLLKRGDFKTNEFLKPNSLVAFFIKTFKTPMDVIFEHIEKFKMAFRMVARIWRTVIAM